MMHGQKNIKLDFNIQRFMKISLKMAKKSRKHVDLPHVCISSYQIIVHFYIYDDLLYSARDISFEVECCSLNRVLK